MMGADRRAGSQPALVGRPGRPRGRPEARRDSRPDRHAVLRALPLGGVRRRFSPP